MSGHPRRNAAIAGAAGGVTAVVMTQMLGPRYVDPLPLWAKLAIVVVGCAFIGAVAVYSRRRARRV